MPPAGEKPDFAALFLALPSPYMVLDRDLTYVEVNDAYCTVTERGRAELIGRSVFEMFPNDDGGGERLRRSFERGLESGRPDSIPLLPYPIPLPRSRGGGFEMRYWSCVHTPLPGPDGSTRFIVQNTVDVTELQQLKQIAYGPEAHAPHPGEADLLQRAREVEAIKEALLEETRGLRDLFMQAPGFMAVLAGPDLRFILANASYQQLIGYRPVIGRPIFEALPEAVGQGFPAILEKVVREREPFIGRAMRVEIQRTPDGPPEERFLDFIYQPIVNPADEVWGVFVEGSDVTEQVRAEQQQALLVAELNHRVKNTIATVQAVAARTVRTTRDPAAFNAVFEARLMALSATHDLLTASNWRSAALSDLLMIELRPYGRERCRLLGPAVDLAPTQAVNLGLIFHELITNAAKYGALSAPGGRLAVEWRVTGEEDAQRLHLTWTESGGPELHPPKRRGFGSQLIERSLGADGHASLEFAPSGLVCRLEMALT